MTINEPEAAASSPNDMDEAIEKLTSLSKNLDDPSSAAIEEYQVLKLDKHFEPSFDQLGANRLQNILEMDLPRPKALLSHHSYDNASQGLVAGNSNT